MLFGAHERLDAPGPWGAVSGRLRPTPALAPISQFERMVEAAAVPRSPPRQEMLGLLLGTTLPPSEGDKSSLNSLWAQEAMHRAYSLVRLFARLERSAPLCASDLRAADLEQRLARDLAATLRMLDIRGDSEVLSCSTVLRTLVRDLVELFGPVARIMRVNTYIEPLALPAHQRRALVLAAFALLSAALCEASALSGARDVSVTLRTGPARGLLRMTFDGAPLPLDESLEPNGIVADLASLLESEPVPRIDADGASTVEIAFPLPSLARR